MQVIEEEIKQLARLGSSMQSLNRVFLGDGLSVCSVYVSVNVSVYVSVYGVHEVSIFTKEPYEHIKMSYI